MSGGRAQYNLARMHLVGAGVEKDGRGAIRWLFLAADKAHLQAEALLGQTLFTRRECSLAIIWSSGRLSAITPAGSTPSKRMAS
jgi:TPR repeat protein